MSARGHRARRRGAHVPGSPEDLREEAAFVAGAPRAWRDELTDQEIANLAKGADCPAGEDDSDPVRYLRHADSQEAAAAVAWKKYLAGLTPDALVDLEARGLYKPAAKEKSAKKGGRGVKLEYSGLQARDNRASEDPDPSQKLMAKEEVCAPAGGLTAVRFILADVVDAEKPRRAASIIALALGIGERQGISLATLCGGDLKARAEVEARVRAWQVRLGLARGDLALARYVVSHIIDDDRPRLTADTFAMALRFPLRQGMSERALAIEYGLTVATLSARVRWWVKELDARLPGVCKKSTASYGTNNVRRQPSDPFAKSDPE